MAQSRTTSEYVRGGLYGVAAVSIWARFIVRGPPQHPNEPGALEHRRNPVRGVRFAAAALCDPQGFALERLPWTALAALVAGCGAPMVLLANSGLLFAPAAHAGALFPGVTPLMVAILAAAILREPLPLAKRIGCALILVGALSIIWGAGGTIGTTQNVGHLLFLSAGLAWACCSLAMRHARLDGLHAAGLAAVTSLALYLSIYAYVAGNSVFRAPLSYIALQATVQEFLTGIALLLYGRVVRILGATSGAAFLAVTPAITGLIGIPILGELPWAIDWMAIDWMAIVVISTGVYVVSGGPLPGEIMRSQFINGARMGHLPVTR